MTLKALRLTNSSTLTLALALASTVRSAALLVVGWVGDRTSSKRAPTTVVLPNTV